LTDESILKMAKIRKEKKLSHSVIGKMFGVHKSQVSRYLAKLRRKGE